VMQCKSGTESLLIPFYPPYIHNDMNIKSDNQTALYDNVQEIIKQEKVKIGD
jgi:hypothetical protein